MIKFTERLKSITFYDENNIEAPSPLSTINPSRSNIPTKSGSCRIITAACSPYCDMTMERRNAWAANCAKQPVLRA
jgi:hypothetical protein